MARFVRQNEVNDIFQLDNGEYVSYPRTMEMQAEEVEEYNNN